MKYLFSLFLFISIQLTFAQLTVTNLDDNAPILDGESFDYDTTVFEDAKLSFKLTNSSATETINVLAQMVSFTNTNGSNLQFCVNPECFFDVTPGSTIPNSPRVLAPGADNGDFDYFSNTNPGNGVNYPMTYTIRFFMVDDNGQEVGDDITITYNYTPENFNTSDFSLKDLGVVLHNTVVSETLNFDSNNKVSFKVYDLNGRQLQVYDTNAGQHQINMSDLSTGYYVLMFKDNSGKQSHVRIQKK
jgi:hypothetical protein